MQNQQAKAAGTRADEIIKNLANPAQAIETDKATVEVLDQAQPVVPVQAAVPEDGNWENRFKGYKSSTDKTLHELRQRVNQFDLVSNENEALKQRLQETEAKIPQTPNEMLELFSEEEVSGFNKMLDGRVGGLQSEVERLNLELTGIRRSEQEAAARQAHGSIVNAVKAAVPNYDVIDRDPAFSEWIKDIDAYGNLRYDMLMAAKNATPPDVGRIVQFYVEFANSNTQVQEEPTHQYTQQELLQTPTSTPSVSAETPQGLGIVWNQATISQFYKDKALGKKSPDELKALEIDMYASIKNRR